MNGDLDDFDLNSGSNNAVSNKRFIFYVNYFILQEINLNYREIFFILYNVSNNGVFVGDDL